jgi:hypothetical protein
LYVSIRLLAVSQGTSRLFMQTPTFQGIGQFENPEKEALCYIARHISFA